MNMLLNIKVVAMKRFFVLFVLLSLFVCTYSQNDVAMILASDGFENVKTNEVEGVLYIAVENRDYRNSYMGVAKAMRLILNNCSEKERTGDVEVVFAENNLPQLHIGVSKDLLECYKLGQMSFSDVVNKVVIDYNTDKAWGKVQHGDDKALDKSAWKVDFVVYPQLTFSNTQVEERLYDYNFCLSPAIEIQLWKGAKFTAQVVLPIFDNMGGQNKKIRPGVIALSQDFDLGAGFKSKLSFGNFTTNRMGGVVDLFWRTRDGRFMIEANGGMTVESLITDDEGWRISDHRRMTGSVATSYYVAPLQTMLKLSVNHHIYGDNSVRADMQRHFANYTVGLYGMYIANELNGGFNVSFPLFPRHSNHNKGFRVRAARSWEMEYSMKSSYKWNEFNEEIGKRFFTSPDARSYNNFMQPDYIRYYVAKYGDEVK